MQQIELSIIIPVYNAEKYIGRCIQSILASPEKREDRFFMRNLKDGRIGTLCLFYKTAIQTKKRLKQLLKGKTK